MFTVKLGTGETFEATNIDYGRSKVGGDNKLHMSLHIGYTPMEHNIEYYLDKLDVEGALDRIQIICEDGTVGFDLEGYTDIISSNVHLLPSGEKSFYLIIAKPIE